LFGCFASMGVSPIFYLHFLYVARRSASLSGTTVDC